MWDSVNSEEAHGPRDVVEPAALIAEHLRIATDYMEELPAVILMMDNRSNCKLSLLYLMNVFKVQYSSFKMVIVKNAAIGIELS